MKRILFLVLIVFLMGSSLAHAEELPDLDMRTPFIQDNANILSETQVNDLNDKGLYLEQGTGVELMLLTMPTTGQVHRQDYALQALRGYGVGKSEEDNGIVILFNLDNNDEFNNRGIEVQVGYGVEGYLNDAKIGRIIDNVALPHFQQGAQYEDGSPEANAQYSQGLANLYQAIYDESLQAYGYEDGKFTRETPIDDSNQNIQSIDDTIPGAFFRLIILFIIIVFIINMFGGGGPRGRRRSRRHGPIIFFPPSGGSGSGGFGGGGFGGFGGGSGGGGGAGRGF